MTTPNTFTFLDGLLQGVPSTVVTAGDADYTISEFSWSDAPLTTPLIVISTPSVPRTITLPTAGAARINQTQVIIINNGADDLTVDRNGANINGAATNDTIGANAVFHYNSDGSNWFREVGGGGGAGSMQGAYDGGSNVTGTASVSYNLTGSATYATTATKITAATPFQSWYQDLAPDTGDTEAAVADSATRSHNIELGVGDLPSADGYAAEYAFKIDVATSSSTFDSFTGIFEIWRDSSSNIVILKAMRTVYDFDTPGLSVALDTPAASSMNVVFANNSGAEVDETFIRWSSQRELPAWTP